MSSGPTAKKSTIGAPFLSGSGPQSPCLDAWILTIARSPSQGRKSLGDGAPLAGFPSGRDIGRVLDSRSVGRPSPPGNYSGTPTTENFFLPDPHLVIHQAVLLHSIAQRNEFGPEIFHDLAGQEIGPGRLAARLQQFLRQILLFLADGQPADVEVIP